MQTQAPEAQPQAEAILLLGFALVYGLLIEITERFLSFNTLHAVAWFPAGLALVGTLLGGWRYGASAFAAELVVCLLHREPWAVAFLMSAGNALAGLVAGYALRRNPSFNSALPTMRDYLLLVVAGVVGTLLSAVVGVGAVYANGGIQAAQLPQSLLQWFGGHAIGLQLLAPALLMWRVRPKGWAQWQRLRDTSLLLVAAFLIGQIVFGGELSDPQGLFAQPYWPFVLVAAFTPRLWRHGVALMLMLYGVQASVAVVQGQGMFAHHSMDVRVIHFWVFMSTLALFAIAGATYFARLIKVQRAIALQEASYRSQFADNSAVLIMFELDGQVIDANQAALNFYGYEKEELLKLTLYQISLRSEEEVRETLQTLAPNGGGRFESRQRLADGSERDVVVSVSLVQMGERSVMHSIVFDVTEQKRAEAEIENLAFFDPLTKLPNRRMLVDRLGQALSAAVRSGRKGALLFIDLDNFKTLNDTHGHEKGDLMLQQTGQRLRECVRFGDTVARLGGDEFMVMLKDLADRPAEAATQVKVVAVKVLAALNQPYQLHGVEHHGSGSVGVALFGDPGDNIDELFKRADMALYESKGKGRNAMRFFDPAMQAAMLAKAQISTELRQAIEAQEFVLHYQVQVDECDRVVGLEALLRWQNPRRGLVSPGQFIGVAEETGLILPLGQIVLQQACQQLAAWAGRRPLDQLSISVNVSARQFRQPDYVQTVSDTLRQTGAPAHLLKLELTESLMVTDVDDVITKMQQLKSLGLRFSLDDFGTGYSSLAYLKSMPLEQLKIDQTFVRDLLADPNDAAIAKAVITLGHSLGLSVVAEGVESQAQRDHLLAQGCRNFQGYLFGAPVPIEQVEERLQGGLAATRFNDIILSALR